MNPDRRQLLAETLDRHGLDGLISWRPEEIVMLTGDLPHWGVSVALATADGDLHLLVPHLEPEVTSSGFAVETFPWGEPGAWDDVAGRIARWAAGRRVAWKGASGHTSLPGNFAENPPWPPSWPSGLPGTRCDEVMDELLAVKTAADVEALRLAHRVAKHALEVFRATAEPGVTEADVAATVEACVLRHTGRTGITTSRAWACVQSGPNTADAGRFNRSTGRVLAAGDRVLMEIAVCVNGYWADLTESLICGGGAEDRPLLALVGSAARAALAAIGPGVPAGEVDRAARAVIAAEGLGDAFTHATGHPTGFRYHDPGPMLAPGSTARLAEGMVLTVEPGIYLPAGGVRLETNVVVTRDSHEILGGGTLQP
jgi:Xaa-Pro dipeptidase